MQALCFKQLLTFHRNGGFHIFAKECTLEIVTDMIAHKASVESKIILGHIDNVHLNTIIFLNSYRFVIIWVYKAE